MALVLGCAAGYALPVSPAAAATPQGRFTIHGFAVAGELSEEPSPYRVVAMNSGSAPLSEPITVEVTVPSGFKATLSEFVRLPAVPNEVPGHNQVGAEFLSLSGCESHAVPGGPETFTCVVHPESGVLAPNEGVEVGVSLVAEPDTPSGLVVSASATAPGSPEASLSEPLRVGGAPLSFGPDAFVAYIAGAGGEPDQQAGDHPSVMSTRFDLNSVNRISPFGPQDREFTSVQDLKDVVVDLPIGLIGSAQATPKCTFAELGSFKHCAFDTRIGQLATQPRVKSTVFSGLYNMVPEHGVAAEFGFIDGLKSSHAIYATVAPTPAGYVVRAVTRELPQIPLTNVTATIFGDPATNDETEVRGTHLAMLTNPSDCAASSFASVHMDSWQQPGVFGVNGTPTGEPEVQGANWLSATSGESPVGGTVSPANTGTVTGCNLLHFIPNGFSVKPDTETADTPTGLSFDLKVPQNEHFGALATPPLRDATVTLPAGMTVDPSSAGGLEACSEAQIGWLGTTGPNHQPLPEVDGPHGKEPNRGLSNFTPAAPTCPEASRIGSVEVDSPVIEGTLQGSVYLAAQDQNPFGSLLAGYIVIDDPTTGVLVKIPGELKTDPTTGQITGVFDQNPQFPFSDLKLRFFGGPRGELATPQTCGTFTTTSDLEPWSAPESGPDATPSDSFPITAGCALGFGPSFTAGTTSTQAGGFSPFTLTLARSDGEQHLTGLTVTMPPGLLGVLKSVPLCGAPQAAAGTCPAETQIGETSVASGVGPSPFHVTGGHVYLTGPYNGGPFGLSIVVPAVAGPFNLGNVVVRSAIHVNETTGQATVASDPLPLMVNSIEGLKSGIPSDIREIDVSINRPGFIFNPTSCEPQTVNATATGAQGGVSNLSSHFQAADCSALKFAPAFSATTGGKGSKNNGTSLNVKVGYPAAPFNGYANIKSTKVELPLALPSRLSTLQKACVAAVFEANPAACPEGSNVGTAIAHTPVLANPLVGPAYLVSHGGAAFPDLEIVLQGENGLRVILDGNTDIKNGITKTTFANVPDTPVSGFELNLPAGPHSALGINTLIGKNYNVCGQNLIMPTTITGQNGAVIKQNTKVGISGCPKTGPPTKAQKLAAALKACHKDKKKAKRKRCEKAARKMFGKAAKASKHKRR